MLKVTGFKALPAELKSLQTLAQKQIQNDAKQARSRNLCLLLFVAFVGFAGWIFLSGRDDVLSKSIAITGVYVSALVAGYKSLILYWNRHEAKRCRLMLQDAECGDCHRIEITGIDRFWEVEDLEDFGPAAVLCGQDLTVYVGGLPFQKAMEEYAIVHPANRDDFTMPSNVVLEQWPNSKIVRMMTFMGDPVRKSEGFIPFNLLQDVLLNGILEEFAVIPQGVLPQRHSE